MIPEEKTSREIEEILFIHPRTVDNHRTNICQKLDLHGTNALLRFALTREITSIYKEAKIIIVTNYNDTHFRESAREAGAVDYILKENLLDILPIIQQ